MVVARGEIRHDLAQPNVKMENPEHGLAAVQLPCLRHEEVPGGVEGALAVDDAAARDGRKAALGNRILEEKRAEVER